jgi:glycosyltransferase involved in cell wall biosynthesis
MMRTATRKKLVYLVTEDWYFVSHRLALACAARDAGHDVTVITRVDRHAETIAEAGLDLVPLNFSRSGIGPLQEVHTLRNLIDLYRKLNPAIVHHVAMKPVIYGSLAARSTRVPAVVNAMMGLGYVFSSTSAKARLLRPFVRLGLRKALSGTNTRVIVQNHDDFRLFESEGLARAENIRLIRGSGVDLDAFHCQDPPPGVPAVILPARILKDKGVEEFVTAARILKSNGVKARFILVGDPDPLNPATIAPAQLAAWIGEGIVEHTGWISPAEISEMMSAASVVCLPSYREGLPKALLEAAAAGRAIVTTDVPGCREIVQPGVNGWRVPPRNPGALAVALTEAITNPALCRQYGAAGRAMVEKDFSIATVIEQTLAVYREFSL